MKSPQHHAIVWDTYESPLAIRAVRSLMNKRSLPELLRQLPQAKLHTADSAAFDYRVYSPYDQGEVEVVYVIINGFGIAAATPDSGIKELITDLLLKRVTHRKYAVLVIGGLFAFPAEVRTRLRKQGSGALHVIASEMASLSAALFPNAKEVAVAGYSFGGVMAPLVARVIESKRFMKVQQVCCGEPNYAENSLTKLQLLRRVSHATAYRNEQIAATKLLPYVAIKQMPRTKRAKFMYRAKQYRPLLRRTLSMRLVTQDLALQAHNHPASSHNIQIRNALFELAKNGVSIYLLHAEHSLLCQKEPFLQLAADLRRAAQNEPTIITIRGRQADHGIEEHRTLSTPFLVKPELYWTK